MHPVGLAPRPGVGDGRLGVVDEVAVVDLAPRRRPGWARPASTSRPHRVASRGSRCRARAAAARASGPTRRTVRASHCLLFGGRARRDQQGHRQVREDRRQRDGRSSAGMTRPETSSRHSPSGSGSVVSPQPPFAASPSGSRVATVIAPPRSNARTWSAAGAGGGQAGVRTEQLGPVAAQGQRRPGDLQLGAPGSSTAVLSVVVPPSRSAPSRSARWSKSTKRRLSGSTRLCSHSSLPW